MLPVLSPQVGNKELKMAPSGSLSNMLAGRLPGLITKAAVVNRVKMDLVCISVVMVLVTVTL